MFHGTDYNVLHSYGREVYPLGPSARMFYTHQIFTKGMSTIASMMHALNVMDICSQNTDLSAVQVQ